MGKEGISKRDGHGLTPLRCPVLQRVRIVAVLLHGQSGRVAVDLTEVLALVTATWPTRLEKGRVIHIAVNAHALPDGSKVHLRVLIQRTADAPPHTEGLQHVDLD